MSEHATTSPTRRPLRDATEWDDNVYARLAALEDVRRTANTLEHVLAEYAPGLFEQVRAKLRASLDAYHEM